jgi:hypothetical protein
VVAAFSLEGVPEPLQPPPGTIEFDSARAQAAARGVVRVAPSREPGSTGAAAAADFVRSRFEEIASGQVAEQRFEASVEGDDLDLRNVLLTLPGSTDQAIVILAARDSRAGTGAASSAAATGLLLELATELGVSGRNRTLVLASIDGAEAEAEGARELLDALPEHTPVDAAIVISQPGPSELVEPHLIGSSGSDQRPSMELVRTAQEALSSRARLRAGLDGAFGQVARLAIPAAAGAQSELLAGGTDAVTLSGAGEVPLPPEAATEDDLAGESLERFGAATQALVASIDAAPGGLEDEPSTYVRFGDNIVPGWAISVLALALLAPPGLAIGSAFARAGREGGGGSAALGWALEWALAGLASLILLYVLALGGAIPRPEVPYDPGQFEIGPLEVVAMLVLAGAGVAVWWSLGVRRAPARASPLLLGAASGAIVVAACLAAWLVNPFLALLLAPLAHVVLIHAAPGRRRGALAAPVALIACVPLAIAFVHVASALDWGGSTPWQLVVLIAGGGLGLVSAAALAVALAGLAALVRSGFGGRTSERP